MRKHEDDNNLQFSLSVSIDRDKYFRRTCPKCNRDFKTAIKEADLAWAVAPQIRRIGSEIGVALGEETEKGSEDYLYCPYCSHQAKASDMLTEETVNYLKRFMMREIVLPMTARMFSGLEDIGKSSGGFISLRIEHSRSMYPPRPIHGPEPPDMKIIEFLCCGKKAKVTDRWLGVTQCVFCGMPVNLV